jgi:choline monooxygenase
MSDVGARALLQPGKSQLPVEWYFDEKLFELEKKLIFDAGPGYVGHELMVPEVHDYRSQEWNDHARLLTRQPDGFYEMSNVCRHRQAIMLQGSGNAKNIVCPIHRWTYDAAGELIGAPHFPANPCLNLAKQKLENWQGLLFKGPRLGQCRSCRNESRGRAEVRRLQAGPRRTAPVQLQLEDLHRGLPRGLPRRALPPGPGQLRHLRRPDVAVRRLVFGAARRHHLAGQARFATYQQWHKAVLDYYNGQLPPHGAIWLTYYPNIMVEWYPHVLVVSTLIPQDVDRTMNVVEFYYPEDIALFEPEFIKAEQAAYMETAIEDDDIGERMDRGRRALMKQGRSEVGPYQSPMEDGMQHFHEFYRRVMAGTSLTCNAMHQRRPSGRRFFYSELESMQSLWMVAASLLFACMGVCVKLGAEPSSRPPNWCSGAASSPPC